MVRRSGGSSSDTGEGVVIDIGTGDGRFVYQSARNDPNRLYIGVDANRRPLEKISEKIHRRPARGGLPNVLFVQAAAEDLPSELDGTADEVHVHFPWGSLLRAVATGERGVLDNLRRICAPGALLEVVIGLDPERDGGEIERLGLPSLSTSFIDSVLAPRYEQAGFDLVERGVLPASEWTRLRTSWAGRLRGHEHRTVIYLVARVPMPR
ncbi:MAG TPA: methyltransferase domain-containing protein [Thermoanaerobaculia bacterium]|nr:methyltransferase domain-containing protein [Thermoanaerobaculia bacterium]